MRTATEQSSVSTSIPPVLATVRKRDGHAEAFDPGRITAAIAKAGRATGEFDEQTAGQLTLRVLAVLYTVSNSDPTVEEIQDVVEEVLLGSAHKRSAKAYILYREQHAGLRQIADAASVDLVDSYLERLDWQVKENSNMAYSLQGLNNYVSSEISRVYWLKKVYPPAVRQAHLDGEFHIHDLNLISVYCVGWDLYDLLVSGFKGARGKAESLPPRHFRSALGQIVNFFYTLQGEAAGAQALASFDTLLAPFVRHDDLGFDEVKQAIRGFVFNLNVPTRVGFQTPFTNLTLDLFPSPIYREMSAVVGGCPGEETYGDFQREMNLINRALFEVLGEGDAKGRVFTFPIPTVNIDRDFDYDDENLEPLWEATAKYGVPYFANFVNSDLSPEDTRSMCCRLRLDTSKLRNRGGGLFGANPLTGSIGVVTLNLPRIGREASSEGEFIDLLGARMDLAKESLEIKRKLLERFTDRQLYPYTSYYLRHIKERDGAYWSNHFSTIGIVGMNEACEALLGCGIADPRARRFSLRVLDGMRDQLAAYQRETGNNYNLEATPAESAGFRLARLDAVNQGADPDGVTGYTNSTQLPVAFSNDVFEVVEHQDELQTRYTGGTVLHVFTGEANINPQSAKTFVKRLCAMCSMPYFTITPTFSICNAHGYLAGEQESCPTCGANCEVYSRVVGYLRPVDQWNQGKAREFEERATFDLG